MTLAALLIILFFLPGFIFNLAYYNPESIPLNISLTHKAVASLFITMVLHAVGLITLEYCIGVTVNFNLFLELLSGTSSNIASLTNNTIVWVVFYLVVLYAVAYCIGSSLRWSIKKYDLDRYSFFRIDSPWFYLFKGKGQADGVKIAATMEIAGNSYYM